MPLTIKPLTAALLTVYALSAYAEEKRHFNIPPQPLSKALQIFAQQSGTPMLYAEASVSGKHSPGISGNYITSEAVAQLVVGSGLIPAVASDGTVTLKPGASAMTVAATGNEMTLPKVTVEADSAYDPEYYADPYNKDYVIPNATSGTKTDTPIMETPLNVQVLSKQVLKDQQAITLDQALKNVSGVTTSNGGSTSGARGGLDQSFFLRGFESQTFFRNGFRLQQGAASKGMANVESVEVLKGSAAILYGLARISHKKGGQVL